MIRVITICLQMSIMTLKSNDIDIYTPNIAKRMINLSNKHIQNNNPIQNDQIVIEKEYREKKTKGCMMINLKGQVQLLIMRTIKTTVTDTL